VTVARAMWNRIETRDHRLMRRVHGWRPPQWFRKFMVLATRLGDGWLWYTLGISIAVFGGPQRFRALLSTGIAAGLGVLLFLGVKRISKRRRPCEIEPHCWSLITPPDEFSFPSGHSITAFAVSISAASFYPVLLWFLLPLAVSIAISRIILGMHFLSDVVVGSSIGAAIGYACAHLIGAI
jgi:undecaprenyl-diphosphatase